MWYFEEVIQYLFFCLNCTGVNLTNRLNQLRYGQPALYDKIRAHACGLPAECINHGCLAECDPGMHHPLQSTTPPSSKFHTTLFKVPHHPLQNTTSPSSKYHITLFNVLIMDVLLNVILVWSNWPLIKCLLGFSSHFLINCYVFSTGICRLGLHCANQRFQKRQYAQVSPKPVLIN